MFISNVEYKRLFTAGELLYRSVSVDHGYSIYQQEGYRWLRFSDQHVQAAVDLNRPWYPVFPYSQAMLMAIVMGELPDSILNLGMGGAAFERFLSYKLPGSQLTAVELNAELLASVQEYFSLPESVKVCLESADEYVANSQQCYGLVMVDLFEYKKMAECINDPVFIADLQQKVSYEGVLTVNLMPDNQAHLLQILLEIRQYFSHVVVFHMDTFENVVLFCRRMPFVSLDSLKNQQEALHDKWGIDFPLLLQYLTYLPEPHK
ncbi:hypothetical protein [Aliamphritea ceti]|uniref:hypothetical protein n=1 Tax=Aliamphritea ceti TaxID=1524258 RepID=UPI0021C2C31B|nr:hypothetical protein [Aliamphritea ceti]